MILVVGATGTLGGIITRRLLAEGRPVRILVRPNSNYKPLVDAGAQPILGDLKAPASLQAACQGIDTVITTANSAMRGGDDNPETVEHLGNIHLIDAAAGAGVKHFIFISLSGADPNSPAPFVAGKGKAEEHLKASGMSYTILAPGPFAEVWVGMVVAAPIQNGLPVTIYSYAKQAFIPMNDVASFAIASVGHPEVINQRLVISGIEPYSFADAAAAFGRLLHRGVDVVQVKPGDPLPTVPPPLIPLMIGLSMGDWSVPMDDLARKMQVRMATMEETLQAMLLAQASSPA